jgi:hypothetical protein
LCSRVDVFRPIITLKEAQAVGLNATPSLEGGIPAAVPDLLVRVESPSHTAVRGNFFSKSVILSEVEGPDTLRQNRKLYRCYKPTLPVILILRQAQDDRLLNRHLRDNRAVPD